MTETRKTKAYFKRLATTRGASWKHVERDYHRWRDQERADRAEDERLRRRAWDHYRGTKPAHQWRKGLRRMFAQSFANGDFDSIPGWDTLAREMANEFPGQLGASAGFNERTDFEPDWSRALFDYVSQPILTRRKADDVILELIDKHATRQEAPHFDPDAIESDPGKLLSARRNDASPKERPRSLPPERGYVEFATNIGALCLTHQEALDTSLPGTAEHREGSRFVQVTPTEDRGKVYATATNGKALAIVQCNGEVSKPLLVPSVVAPKSGAKAGKPRTAAIDGDRWRDDKGIECGRVNDDLVEFPPLKIGVDSRAEGFCLDVADIVRLAKALGAKRLGFYPAPGDANDGEKLVAVLPMDPESAIGAGVMISQPDYLPTAKEFSDSLLHVLGCDPPDWRDNSKPVESTASTDDDALESFLGSLT